MKTVAFLITSFTLVSSLNAQPVGKAYNEKGINYFNGFQHAKNDPAKIHLALSYAQGLARKNSPTLQSLLHDHYAQDLSKLIIGRHDNTTQRKLLALLVSDTSQVLTEATRPIALWVQVQENGNNPETLLKLTNRFMSGELSKRDPYPNRIARYGLLIYQLIYQKPGCEQVAQSLMSQTLATLKHSLNKHTPPSDAIPDFKRAHLRYLYAYGHFLMAQQAQKEGDQGKALVFYRTAADYSPDISDQNARSGYFYDIVFLTGAEDKDNFKQDYLQLLSADPENPEALRTLTALSVSDPANLPHLKSFYQQHYSVREPFGEYWEKEMDKAFTLAPDFTLVQLNKASFSLEAHKGKWVLTDFWGTWCSPCLEEMPRMQSFYREVILKHADKISLLTIACRDTEAKVSTYLNKNRYNFPVALSDGTVEKAYAVTAYPTKILVTPKGKQIIIPAGEDWVEKVKGYCQF